MLTGPRPVKNYTDLVIYQILPRLFGNVKNDVRIGGSLSENGTGKFSDIDSATLDYLQWLGCSHIYLTGILNHATVESSCGCSPSNPAVVKGRAGSAFAIKDHYDVAPYLADKPSERMREFHDLVDRIHAHGLKVIIDFVPNHVSRDYGMDGYHGPEGMQLGLSDDKSVHWSPENDFFYYPGQYLTLPKTPGASAPYIEYPAKASGNCFSPAPGPNDWYETVKINYCDFHTSTWDKMLSVLLFWARQGVDGFRCDMVELVPKEFFTWAIAEVKNSHPDIIFIAEVYQKSLYQTYVREVGFDYLYDKSGTYDINRNIIKANIEGQSVITQYQSALSLTSNWQNLGSIQPYMLNFLENHDEQRFASSFYASDPLKAKPALWSDLFLNRAPFMIYFGQELGERGEDAEGFSSLDGRTTIFDWWTTQTLKDLWLLIHSKAYEKARLTGPLEKYEKTFRMYSSALRAKNQPSIEKSLTYDLNYCNYSSPGFDRDRHFAFLRATDKNILLFVCNYSVYNADIDIYIPKHAFDYVPIKATESLNPDTPIRVHVGSFGAECLKLK